MLKHEIVKENGNWVVYINNDGMPGIYQPHHPNAALNQPWESYEKAEEWAIEMIERLNTIHSGIKAEE
jgi:hypothetical protein